MSSETPKDKTIDLRGIWRSHYKYPSSSRKAELENEHYVLVEQRGNMLTMVGLPHTTESRLELQLALDGRIATGTWREYTAPAGYYKGKIYHGAIQVTISADHTKMVGKWLGFGKELDINVGTWDFTKLNKKEAEAASLRGNAVVA